MCIKKNEDMALGRSEQNEEKNIAPSLCLHWRVSNITSSQPWHEFLLAWFFETDVEPHHLSHGPHATASKHLPGCADFPSPFALSLPCWTDAVPVKPSLPRRWGGWASQGYACWEVDLSLRACLGLESLSQSHQLSGWVCNVFQSQETDSKLEEGQVSLSL